jgi:ABC-type transport system involved in multi-copper enzyme maturation permease subunit
LKGLKGRSGAVNAFRAELVKLVGSRAAWSGLAAAVGMTLLAGLAYRFVEAPRDPTTLYNGFGCLGYSLSVGAWTASLLLLLYASLTAVQERAWGTLAFCLTRPVGRRGLFAAKVGALGLATFLVFTAVAAAAVGGAAVLYGFGDVEEVVALGSLSSTYLHHTCDEMALRSLLALCLTLAPLGATACLGFLCSHLFRRTSRASAAALLSFFILEFFVKRFSDNLWKYTFQAYTDRFGGVLLQFAQGVSTAAFEREEVIASLATSAGFAILSLLLSFIVFMRRDIE